jgi:hypothetical protein
VTQELHFTSWQRSDLFDGAVATAGRMRGTLDLTLTDSTQAAAPAPGSTSFLFRSATDIAALTPAAIHHRAPAPGDQDAEWEKCVHVDFTEVDFPWRYTPEPVSGTALRPWLVLLAGTADEMRLSGPTAAPVPSLLNAHPLSTSASWAHTQKDKAGQTVSRLICARPLDAQTAYIAVIVPAFNAAGAEMWTDAGVIQNENHPLPVFDSWQFVTSSEGDFETLAEALTIPPAGAVGTANLLYSRAGRDFGPAVEVRGALTSLASEHTPPDAQLNAIRDDLLAISRMPALPGPVPITLPQYGRPWVPDPLAVPAGWPLDLNDDPRHRSVAGTGRWMGVEGQDSLIRAATEQAGALDEAAGRVSQLAAGLLAGARLWRRSLPADPAGRLRVLGPLLSRLLVDDGTDAPPTVLGAITGDDTYLDAALFSGAAQRVSRPAALAHAADDARAPGAILAAVNAGPAAQTIDPDSTTAASRDLFGDRWGFDNLHIDRDWLEKLLLTLLTAARDASVKFRRIRRLLQAKGADDEIAGELAERAKRLLGDLEQILQEFLGMVDHHCEVPQLLLTAATACGGTQPIDLAAILLDRGDEDEPIYGALQAAIVKCVARCQSPGDGGKGRLSWCDLLVSRARIEPPSRARPIDLDALSTGLQAALDPRGAAAPALVRVRERLVGIELITAVPVRYPLGIDFPTWSLLKQYEQEWLLPGGDTLANNSITALKTNPTFIDAFLAGINSQFLAETRWRGMHVDRLCTPLKMFWGQIDYTDGTRKPDIQPFDAWTDPQLLGSLEHQAIAPFESGAPDAERLVVIFRTPLFRRYPRTVVYLLKGPTTIADSALTAPPQLTRPAGMSDADWHAQRIYFGPQFTGSLNPDLVFFMFDVPPEKLADYWLVLDEPPAELRFISATARPLIETNSNSALVARMSLDHPTRVVISGSELLAMGGGA